MIDLTSDEDNDIYNINIKINNLNVSYINPIRAAQL